MQTIRALSTTGWLLNVNARQRNKQVRSLPSALCVDAEQFTNTRVSACAAA